MDIKLKTTDDKEHRIFRLTLTCNHCHEPLQEEQVVKNKPLEQGIVNKCSICDARIRVNIELYEGIDFDGGEEDA